MCTPRKTRGPQTTGAAERGGQPGVKTTINKKKLDLPTAQVLFLLLFLLCFAIDADENRTSDFFAEKEKPKSSLLCSECK